MKTVATLLCTLSIGAGIVVGAFEHRSSRAASGAGAQPAESANVIALPPPPPKTNAKRQRVFKPGELDLVAVGETRPAPVEESAAPEPRTVPLPASGAPGVDASLRARLEAIARLLDREEFAAAEKAARELAAGTPAAAEAANRLAATARVYRQVAGRQPAVAAGGSAFEVFLANGLKVMARESGEGPEGYVFRLMKGAVFTAAREDVLEVRKIEAAGTAVPAWEDLQVRIARLTHPIDIFVDGVERCLRFGYRKEALRILDGLLARAESDKLPLLFFPDAGDAFARDWRIAGGRAGEAPGASVASASEAADSSTAGDPARPSAGRTEAEDGSLDPGSLAEAERLVGEARALLQAIVGKDSQTADRQAVRERLDRALVLLDALSPQHDQVKKLRREVGQLLSDASRTIPF